MKPDWDKLMAEFKDHRTILVADVDCTGEGKPLCSKFPVKGFPTILHGDPLDAAGMTKYTGQRTFEALRSFASSLKLTCSPTALDRCSTEEKKLLESFLALSAGEMASKAEELQADFEKKKQAVIEMGQAVERAKTAKKYAAMVLALKQRKKDEL
eukprot:TRINITY_DN67706_c0_g1_i1.p1 TRINITY_DN67706_c0_g1~~TRINITY_DN67706_c0_g1_i1.p1  ORF type:complete len:155 (-),score=37.94 TRINITY_DN67706_c0_g1_i1:176-640(-)